MFLKVVCDQMTVRVYTGVSPTTPEGHPATCIYIHTHTVTALKYPCHQHTAYPSADSQQPITTRGMGEEQYSTPTVGFHCIIR